MTTKTLKLKGMHCVSCSMLIEGELEDMGVEAKANYAKQTVDLVFDESITALSKIKGMIEKLGYGVIK
ncbi:MAG: heavy-metal-associated domain-containing protein [Candidatus Gottesmanbacteria bacterium]